jgi:F-type H+-transporting ATPase subunit b
MARLALWVLALAPSLAFASGSGREAEAIPWGSIGAHAFNLAVLLAVLYWFARRPISDALRTRATSVRRAIESAQKERDLARAQLDELEEKLADFELQVERLRKEMAEQAQHEREQLVARAEREVATVRAAAVRAVRDETRRARRQLQEQSVTLGVALAERILASEASDADQQVLARQLLASVGEGGHNFGGADHGA